MPVRTEQRTSTSPRQILLAALRSRHRFWLPAGKLVGLLLVVVGCKAALIGAYSSPLPFLDQWEGEAETLLKPWAEGRGRLADLFASHNEHRIVPTKALTLLLFWWNDAQWDAQVEMLAGAAVHALCAGALFLILRECCCRPVAASGATPSRRDENLLLCVCLPLFCLPFGWQNTLWGFQSQFYFAILFAVLTIWGLGSHSPRAARWWLGLGSGLAGGISLAAGVVAPACVFLWRIFCAVFQTQNRAQRRDGLVTVAAAGLLTLLGIALPDPSQGAAANHARSAGEFFASFLGRLAWPNFHFLPGAALLFAPWVWLLIRRLRARAPHLAADAFLLPLGAWVILQMALLAYARGRAFSDGSLLRHLFISRYMDFSSLGVLGNFAALLLWLREPASRAPVRFAKWALGVAWAICVIWGLQDLTQLDFRRLLPEERRGALQRLVNVRSYILTHDAGHLARVHPGQVPLADRQRLINDLEDPTIRAMLPAAVCPPLELRAAAQEGFALVPDAFAWPAFHHAANEAGWSSAPTTTGSSSPRTFRSEQCVARRPYWEFTIAGGGLTGAREKDPLRLSAARADSAPSVAVMIPNLTDQLGYRRALVRTPRDAFQIEATANAPRDAVAFSQPREVGRLSAWVPAITDAGKTLALLGGGLLLATIAAESAAAFGSAARRRGGI